MRMDIEIHPETLNKTKQNNYKKYTKNVYNYSKYFQFKKNKLIFFYFNIKYSATEEHDN